MKLLNTMSIQSLVTEILWKVLLLRPLHWPDIWDLETLSGFMITTKLPLKAKQRWHFPKTSERGFDAYNWHIQHVDDANNLDKLEKAIFSARKESGKPSLIIIDSHIAYGSPNRQDTCEAHGAPLGDEEVKLTKEFYGWDPDKTFHIPDEVKQYGKNIAGSGEKREQTWNRLFDEYSGKYPELAQEFELIQKGELPEHWDRDLPEFPPDVKGVPTRKANNKIMNTVGSRISWLLGGAADVGSSTNTYLDNTTSHSKNDPGGRNFHFGIREHAMAAIANGLALSKLRPYASTYFIFSDYLKPALRLSAIMKQPVIYIFTHDSIGLGEDGPTHQPIEQLPSLRSTPNVDVIRPADANELSVLWKHAMNTNDHPVVFALTRQNIPVIDREKYLSAKGSIYGGYVVAESDGVPELIIISTGSEVSLCLGVYEKLKEDGINSRVVSLPSWEIFDKQTKKYKEKILPSKITKRMSVEAGSTFGWERYVGSNGRCKVFGLDSFGESAPCNDVMKEFGFTVENLYAEAKKLISK